MSVDALQGHSDFLPLVSYKERSNSVMWLTLNLIRGVPWEHNVKFLEFVPRLNRTGHFFVSNALFNGILRLPLSESVDVNLVIGDNALANVEFSELFRVYLHATLQLRDEHISMRTLNFVNARRRPEYKLLPVLYQSLEGCLLDFYWRSRGS